MAVSVTGVGLPTCDGRLGPFKDASGDLWIVGRGSANGYSLVASKSADDGATWNTPITAVTWGSVIPCIDAVYDSGTDSIYVVAVEAFSGGLIYIYKLNCATETWSNIASDTNRPTAYDSTNGKRAYIARRESTGEFVIAYQGPTHSSMGNEYRSVYYARCSSGGVWEVGVEVDAGGAVHYDLKAACGLGSVSFFYTYSTNNLYQRMLSGANALYDPVQVAGGVPGNHYTAHLEPSEGTYGTLYVSDGNSPTYVWRGSAGNTPDWAVDTGTIGNAEPGACAPAFIHDPNTSKLHAFFRDTTSDDLYENSTTTTTWTGSGTLKETASGVLAVSAGLTASGLGVAYQDSAYTTARFTKVTGAVGHSVALPYKVPGRVGHSAILRYAVLRPIGTSRVLPYGVKQLAGTSRILRYAIAGKTGRSVALRFNLIEQIHHSAVLPYLVTRTVGHSAILRYAVWKQIGQSRVLPYSMIGRAGRSAILRYYVAQSVWPAGHSIVLPYKMGGKVGRSVVLRFKEQEYVGASRVLLYKLGGDVGRSVVLPYMVYFAWVPPLLPDLDYAREPFPETQHLLAGAPTGRSHMTTAGWHGTTFNGERGAVAIVQAESVLADLVGSCVRVSRTDRAATSVYAYVLDSGDTDEPISLSRRAFLEIGLLNATNVSVLVEEVE